MALVPTRPFFDSFQSSPFFCNSLFRHSRTSSPNSTFLRPKPLIFFRCNPARSFSSEKDWLKRWNHPANQHHRPKPPRAVLDYQGSGNGHASKSGSVSSDEEGGGNSRGSTMDRIVEKLKKIGYAGDGIENKEKVIEKGSVEDIFYVEEGMLPNARGGFSAESPLGFGIFGRDDGEARFPWEKSVAEELEDRKSMRRSKPSLAQLTLPESELKRLLRLTFEKKHKTRIGRSGVTQAVVDKIHERWKTAEIVRLKFEGEAALNMKRMHEILEVCCLSLASCVSRKYFFVAKLVGCLVGTRSVY
ncbi:unnamed protein product [Sphenostylis stenocarpa]|uniref:CRM domain-containing protein n=1 Tax=Sphenostylis stenocarpa TaxID=92480 RepID=A0AA86W1C4_9FABA|nr:unnamed protein product [Sphenostylis stenocarpa]